MFKSCHFYKSLGYQDGKFINQHKIIDSDFESIIDISLDIGLIPAASISVGIISSIIQEYNKRNLNIAANLAMAILWNNKKSSNSISQIVEWSEKYIPEFHSYRTDIEKYLLLI